MACGFACAQICTLWKLKIPSRVNIASLVKIAFKETVGAGRIVPNTSGKTLHGKANPLASDAIHVADDMDTADLRVVSSKQDSG